MEAQVGNSAEKGGGATHRLPQTSTETQAISLGVAVASAAPVMWEHRRIHSAKPILSFFWKLEAVLLN